MIFLLKTAQFLSLAISLGAIVFFSFFAAPAIFQALPKEQAGEVISVVISRYYVLTIACGLVAVASAVLLGLHPGGRGVFDLVKTVLLMLMLAATLYGGVVLHPKVRSVKSEMRTAAAPETRAQLEAAFAGLHRRSVLANGAALACGLGAALLLASRLSS